MAFIVQRTTLVKRDRRVDDSVVSGFQLIRNASAHVAIASIKFKMWHVNDNDDNSR